MKKTFLIVLYICSYTLLSAQTDSNFVKNQLIVKFKENKKTNSQTVLQNKKFGFSTIDVLNKHINVDSINLTGNKQQKDTYIIRFNSNQNMTDLIKQYKETNLFEYVEPNYIAKVHGILTTPNDPGYNNNQRQWVHNNNGTFPYFFAGATNDADMDTDLAWDITQGDPNIVIAVIDSGLKLDHPEVSGRIWVNSNELANSNDSDSNGFMDDIYGGWDFVNNDNVPEDNHGHGTLVTGAAIATGNNSVGYAGMNWNSKVMICKVLNTGNNVPYSLLSDAIYYAVDNGANVINISIGGSNVSNLVEDAVNYAYNNNVPVIASTGNENSTILFPAKYTNTFAIGSTNPNDSRSNPFPGGGGSNYGPEIDFVAPGNYIYVLDYQSNTNYDNYASGTSLAAPHVTGLISLILSLDPTLTVDQIRTILKLSSEDQVGGGEDTLGWDQYYGHGRVNAYQALNSIDYDSTVLLSVNEENKDFNNFSILPNPLSNENNITIKNLNQGKYAINIYNTLGQALIKTLIIADGNNKIELNIPELNKGTYFVKITNKDKTGSVTKKLIIK